MYPFLGLLWASMPDEFTTVPQSSSCRVFNTVMSQGDCGSCAAFATAYAIAMRLCLRDGTDFIPSPFRIFDCSGHSCDQGLPLPLAMAIAQYGVSDLQDSPPRYGLPCDLRWEQHTPAHLSPVALTDRRRIKESLINFGPLPASTLAFHHRHAIVLLGWDQDGWLIQNSWGENAEDDRLGRRHIPYEDVAFALDIDLGPQTQRWVLCMELACISACIGFVIAAIRTHKAENPF